MSRTPALMVLGTGSHVGKSLITAAFCRIFAQAGIRVSPFKAQNMSLNSAATPEGLEIGRAQALQAEAAGIAPSAHMNPILLKPTSNTASQVIVRGKVFAQFDASDYFRHRNEELFPIVQESYEILAAKSELMVLEGAGSPAEINLKDRDIVNLRMAQFAGAACVLVGDIDRGGVFASLLGTLELLDPSERDLIAGFIINKFRGDIQLLLPGITMLEQRIKKPCLGVIPYIENLMLDEEDNVAMECAERAGWTSDTSSDRPLRVAVVQFPSISNFTDFDALKSEPSVEVRFCRAADEMNGADVVILPGTKQTLADLRWIRASGIADAIFADAEKGIVVGICGGLQMLGTAIDDPYSAEGGGHERGLGLLAIRTVMSPEKTTQQAAGEMIVPNLLGLPFVDHRVCGYEIHLGETEYLDGAVPFARIRRAESPQTLVLDGCVHDNGRIIGTYLHGIFDDDVLRHRFIQAARSACRLNAVSELVNWKERRETELNCLANTVTASVDWKRLLQIAGFEGKAELAAELL